MPSLNWVFWPHVCLNGTCSLAIDCRSDVYHNGRVTHPTLKELTSLNFHIFFYVEFGVLLCYMWTLIKGLRLSLNKLALQFWID